MNDVGTDDYGMVDIDNPLVKSTLIVDDGCDWTARIVWTMNARRRMRNGVYQPPPETPKVSKVSFKPIKAPKKKRQRKVKATE